MISANALVFRQATMNAWADFRAMYSWRTWLFAWLLRVLCQVSFFALIGRLIDSPDRTRFLLIGNSAFIAASCALFVVASTARERLFGTLSLVVAAPCELFLVIAGRSVQWLVDGTGCAVISLFVLSGFFGVSLPMPVALAVIPLTALIACSTYAFGLCLGVLVLGNADLRNIVGNVATLAIMLLCGVQVPLNFWPAPVEMAGRLLPLSHGLLAIRVVLDHGPSSQVLAQAGLELLVGACWLLVAFLLTRVVLSFARRSGTLDYG